MGKPKVMLLLTCEDGHQVETFPDKAFHNEMYWDNSKISLSMPKASIRWECPRCEVPKKYVVEM